MFFKLARQNVKRSVQDYTIYFLTLTIAVCVFYSFNSIESQRAFIELMARKASYMEMLTQLISGTSIFISFVLGGLIIYANNFLMKKRKKELGIYMTLGMPKRHISIIFVLETLIIGIASLAVGITLGVIASQGLSVATAKLLGVPVTTYEFLFSTAAFFKTVLYFTIIYVFVMLFNQFVITKHKLIDLLYASRKNETIKLFNATLSTIILGVSIAVLIVAYVRIITNGFDSSNNSLLITLLLGVIGTFGFFFSLSSVIMSIVQQRKSVYYNDLNIFVLRQMHHKVNTNFLSMAAICLMLFLTMTLLFAMLGYKTVSDQVLEGNLEFDASAALFIEDDTQKIRTIEQYFAYWDVEIPAYERYSFFTEYELNVSTKDILGPYLSKQEQRQLEENYRFQPVHAITNDDYNALLALKGADPVLLASDEVLIVSNYNDLTPHLQTVLDTNELTLYNKTYTIQNDAPIEDNIWSTTFSSHFFYVIVPNTFDAPAPIRRSGINIMFDDEHTLQSEETYTKLFENVFDNLTIDDSFTLVVGTTREDAKVRAYGTAATIVFLGIYIGLIFLISSTAVLALQQLSDASESVERYKTLQRIGVPQRLMDRAIFKQTMLYFLTPLTLAVVHTAVAIYVLNTIFETYKAGFLGSSLAIIAITFLLIYGGYFYATYIGVKNIVKQPPK